MRSDVYVPTGTTTVDAGSGVVGTRAGDEQVLLDYEGNRYGAENLQGWADRVHSAAGRAQTRYPTAARRLVKRSDVVHVGTYESETGEVDLSTGEVDEETARRLVAAWVGDEPACETTSVHAHTVRREVRRLNSGTPQEQLLATWYASTLR